MVMGKIYFSKKVISLATHTEKMLSDNQLKLLFHVHSPPLTAVQGETGEEGQTS